MALVATTGFLGVLVGGLITHRFSLGRERRKEHNEQMLPLKKHVSACIDNPYDKLEKEDISPIRHLVSAKQYDSIMAIYEEYSAEYYACFTGEGIAPYQRFEKTPALVASLHKLFNALPLK
ncbi:TPA: hypothetical protein ACNOH7_001976 [Vibrio fluvialis]